MEQRDAIMLTITDLADVIADARSLSPDERKQLHRELRHHHKQGRITAAGAKDERGTALFDEAEACRASLLTILSEGGLKGEGLERANRCMSQAADARLQLPAMNGSFPPVGLDAAIDGVKKGEKGQNWSLRVQVMWDCREQSREQLSLGGFERADQPPYPESDPRSRSSVWRDRDILHGFELVVRCEDHFPAVIRAFAELDSAE